MVIQTPTANTPRAAQLGRRPTQRTAPIRTQWAYAERIVYLTMAVLALSVAVGYSLITLLQP